MPVRSNTLLRDTADLVSPDGNLVDNGYGTLVAGPTSDAVVSGGAGIKVGIFPMSTIHDWIMRIGGGPENTRDWQVAVPGKYAVAIGMAFVVASGANPGTYRIKQVTRGVTRSALTLCICNRER